MGGGGGTYGGTGGAGGGGGNCGGAGGKAGDNNIGVHMNQMTFVPHVDRSEESGGVWEDDVSP